MVITKSFFKLIMLITFLHKLFFLSFMYELKLEVEHKNIVLFLFPHTTSSVTKLNFTGNSLPSVT